jgi:hypothetical protein
LVSKVAAPADHLLAYLTAMYLSVVPAGERAALDRHYVFGVNLPGLVCGSGCSGMFGAQARPSFDGYFFAMSISYQRNTLAHEAAHAYGLLYLPGYADQELVGLGRLDGGVPQRGSELAGSYDAEARAACVTWKESGFNTRVDQVRAVCTESAASLAMTSIGKA